jgi:ABC-2 type transport system permease protein
MSPTLTIAKREFRSNFDSPVAYIVICVGLVALGAAFFKLRGGYWQVDKASMQPLFYWAPWGLSVLASVVTMRLLAEEKRSGTLEMLITLPVRDHEVILGKFLGAWGLLLVLIAGTTLFPIMMFRFPWHLGELDVGPVYSGYLGLVLYSATAVSIGLLISALTDSQVVAVILTIVFLALLHMVGMFVEDMKPSLFREVVTFLSFDAHLVPFARGQIITRDIIYFLSITVGCLMAAFRVLERRKWA